MLIGALAAYFVLVVLAYVAMVAASASFYRTRDGEVEPFTVIKPLKGAEAGLEENLRSLLAADRDSRLQVLFAMEDEDDPARAAVLRVLAAFPGRDARIVITGPSGARMGKMHNMIEALPHARHPRVVFSDSDVAVGRAVLVETSEAFARGADAVYAAPYYFGVRGVADALFACSFNHGFAAGSALARRLGLFRAFSGAWMGFTRKALDRVGGLEPLATAIADDYALGMEMVRAGARVELAPALVELREAHAGLRDALRHFYKWGVVIRGAVPEAAALVIVHSGLTAAFFAAAIVSAARGSLWPLEVYAAGTAVRMAGAAAQDKALTGGTLPVRTYLLLAAMDLGQLPFWLATLPADTFVWRGKTYRLAGGRRLEVVGPRR